MGTTDRKLLHGDDDSKESSAFLKLIIEDLSRICTESGIELDKPPTTQVVIHLIAIATSSAALGVNDAIAASLREAAKEKEAKGD